MLLSTEKIAIESFRKKSKLSEHLPETDENILKVIVQIALSSGDIIRKSRFQPDILDIVQKEDNSPVSNVDKFVEHEVKKALERVFPKWGFVGEETGGDLHEKPTTVAVDPIDGTWSFLTHDTTNAFSLSVFQNNEVILGLVLNPSTAELAYAQRNKPTRLLQLGILGEDTLGRNLPSIRQAKNDIIVNIQPAKGHRELEDFLKNAWDKKEIKFVKSMGGSPANALMEVAKGHFSYIHPWQIHPTSPYDLSAGIKIVQNAGGLVVDMDNNPIKEVGHRGTLIASCNANHRLKIINLFKENF